MSCNGLSWTQGVQVLLVAAGLLVTACETHTPALDLVLERYPALGTGIYEELSQWESVLGEPETVVQTDGGQTFFYWPERSIAVFTHPLYEGQLHGRGRADRKVTSVILPLRKSFRPGFLPVADEVVVRFDQLLDTRRLLPDSTPSRPPTRSGDTAYVDLSSSPFRKTVERLHLVDGEPIAIEIRAGPAKNLRIIGAAAGDSWFQGIGANRKPAGLMSS